MVPFIPIVFAGCDVCVGPTQRLAARRSGFCTWTSYLGGRVACYEHRNLRFKTPQLGL